MGAVPEPGSTVPATRAAGAFPATARSETLMRREARASERFRVATTVVGETLHPVVATEGEGVGGRACAEEEAASKRRAAKIAPREGRGRCSEQRGPIPRNRNPFGGGGVGAERRRGAQKMRRPRQGRR